LLPIRVKGASHRSTEAMAGIVLTHNENTALDDVVG
jgi:hypothetical protein